MAKIQQTSKDYTISKSTHVTMNSWGLWASIETIHVCSSWLSNKNPLYGVPSLWVIWNTKEHELWGLDDRQLWARLKFFLKYENIRRKHDTWYNLSKRSGSRLHYSHLLVGAWSTAFKKKRILDSPVISLDPLPSIISITSLSTHEFLTHRYLNL